MAERIQYQVDVLLSCGNIISIIIESVLKKPKIGDKIVCAFCRAESEVIKVGTPYRITIKEEVSQ